ncbi:WXG100 family type VII secretion target [Nocardioides sp.]|uniref:WXG100 family type VII secretion target n=1 Tax=Nocardioides sp. TaxID=35761 RepID=UPI0019C97657|nr:WXG100 family type VII secretion target [Nocardioides sp.]MBC7277327.1 WXG100 family type VII secretion target [Nocardioides sp.]
MSSEMKQGQAINVAVNDIAETKGKLQSISASVASEARAGKDKGWHGAGGNAFGKLIETWERKSRDITNALDELTNGLTEARKAGTRADEDVAGATQSVSSSMDSISFKMGG